MPKHDQKGEIAAVHEIKKKIRLLNLIVTFVIVVLFLVILRYAYHPVGFPLDFLPDISIALITGIVFALALIGLYLFRMLSRQTVGIIQEYGSKLERILDITSDLREEIHGDILLEKIMDYALSITRSEAGSILLLHDDNKLAFTIVRGEKADLLLGTHTEVGKGIAGWVAEKGLSVRIQDASKDERFNPEIDAMTGIKTKSVLCVPLKTRSRIVGVLELLNKDQGQSYGKTDEAVITYLAEQAATSIIKTRFFEDQKNYEIHITEMMLGAMDVHIPENRGHSRRVARYGNVIAGMLDLPEERKKKLYFACLLHDIGFLKIRSDDAYKKEEFMRHPVVGYEMINPISFYTDIAPFILHHHERYDGGGYPSQLKGEDIPLEARIIAVAEAFDAMTSHISYRVPISFDEAKEELKRNAGKQFDPELVKLFVKNIKS
jgi:putative methionine-R-sulfoxide reductase with GAF domain